MTAATDPTAVDSSTSSSSAAGGLRLLFVCGGSYVSGAEIIELSVMCGLKKRGHHVRCLSNAWNDGDFPERLAQADIPHRAISLGMISKSLQPKHLWWTLDALLHLPKAYLDFWKEQRRFQPDLFVFSGSRSISTLLPLLDLDRVVLHVHESPGGSRHFRRIVKANSTGGCRAYIAVSEFIRDRLIEEGAPSRKVHAVHNGVDRPSGERTAATVVEAAAADAPLHIGIVGQVGAWKGHDDFVEALALLKQEGYTFQGHIFGRGEDQYTRALKCKLDREGLTDFVTWHGFVSDVEVIYSVINVCVVPSRSEDPFPTTALEAGMRGLPVVATRKGGLPESVVDGETGFLVEAETPAQIADRIELLIDNPERRDEMGTAARRHVMQHFTTERMVDEIEDLFRQLAREIP